MHPNEFDNRLPFVFLVYILRKVEEEEENWPFLIWTAIKQKRFSASFSAILECAIDYLNTTCFVEPCRCHAVPQTRKFREWKFPAFNLYKLNSMKKKNKERKKITLLKWEDLNHWMAFLIARSSAWNI